MTVKIDADSDGGWEQTTTSTIGQPPADPEEPFIPSADTTPPTTAVIGADADWHNAPVAVTFSATDNAGGSGMSGGSAKTEYKLDAGDWTTGTSLTVPAPPNTKTTHTILYRSTDNVGNLEDAKSCTVKIDTTGGPPPPEPPTTSASGHDAGWHHHPVTVTFAAVPSLGGLPVAYTEYSLGGDWTKGTAVTLPAPGNHSGDGVHTLGYRSADIDVPANLESAKSCTVRIDTRKPTTTAPSSTSVRRYQYVRLNYKIADVMPCASQATVTIKIKTLEGATKKTIKLGKRSVNTLQSYRFKCTLPKRTYRFYVYATDGAGNLQAKVGSNRLVVR